MIWTQDSNLVTQQGASEAAIGTGLINSTAIVSQANGASTAAGAARAYTGGGKTDWYLPSILELSQMYIQRVAIGRFAAPTYWSSSETGDGNAWIQTFSSNHQYQGGKSDTFYVRPVRAF